jgi:hypothetical protein
LSSVQPQDRNPGGDGGVLSALITSGPRMSSLHTGPRSGLRPSPNKNLWSVHHEA